MTTQIKGNDTSTFGGGLDLGSNTITTTGSITGDISVDALSTATGAAPSYSARAWVNFNGTGTVAIRDSGNVSSITDNGTGKFTVNFTTAMPDINYSMHIDSMPTYNWTGDVNSNMRIEDMTTTNCRFGSAYNTGSVRYDNTANCVTIFR
jgi:hypothetical protein